MLCLASGVFCFVLCLASVVATAAVALKTLFQYVFPSTDLFSDMGK